MVGTLVYMVPGQPQVHVRPCELAQWVTVHASKTGDLSVIPRAQQGERRKPAPISCLLASIPRAPWHALTQSVRDCSTHTYLECIMALVRITKRPSHQLLLETWCDGFHQANRVLVWTNWPYFPAPHPSHPVCFSASFCPVN